MKVNSSRQFYNQCGVRQGGVLSPYLFSLYIDDVIKDLRKSGYGIYVETTLQDVLSMQMTLFCCHAVTMGCKKW